jgi:hypothetical protein
VSRIELFYDERDDASHEARGSQILYWLDDLGARPLSEAKDEDRGFLFAGARSNEDYAALIRDFPGIRDRAEERKPLLRLDTVLERLARASVSVPTPRTWWLPLGAEPPEDLRYPLFLRTPLTSLKLGGHISRVTDREELEAEAGELRRVLGWDQLILARAWHDLAEAGSGTYGPIPQEIRVWIVDGDPLAWSFHYLNVLPAPKGFPPPKSDLRRIESLATEVGAAFESRCIVADFAKEVSGEWLFIEAGPGSCAGTAHETVFKSVASALQGVRRPIPRSDVGGGFA